MSATYTFDFSSSSSASSPAAVKGRHCASFSSTSSGSNTPYHHHHHHVRQLSAGQPANPESPWYVVSLANSTPATPGVAPAFAPTVAPLQTVSDVVRYRHNVQYNYTKPVSAGARGLSLCKALLPKDVEALTGGAPTPLPSTHLTSCIFYSHADLTAIGRTREANARLLATETIAASGAGTSAVFVGQLGHGLSSTQMLGVVAVLAPDAMLTCPEMHSLGRGIGMGKGSCHARVRTDTLVHAVNADRGCYHDREGVWIATCEAGRRQLFIFEELMKHYHNGVPTGRPLNLMTVSVASNQRLGLPSTRM